MTGVPALSASTNGNPKPSFKLGNSNALARSQGVLEVLMTGRHRRRWCLGGELVQAKHKLRLAVCCLVLVDDALGSSLIETLHSHLEGFYAYF